MIKIENTEIVGLKHSIRGMRNPKDSWEKSDSYATFITDEHTLESAEFGFFVGDDDLNLMKKLSKAGRDHRKFMRMIVVYLDITAPLFWWKEFDTYKVGTVADSCSTMHTIHKKEIGEDLFSLDGGKLTKNQQNILKSYLSMLEDLRQNCQLGDEIWRSLIELLPSGFNQKRTVMLNYEVLANIYHSRRSHKLKEWRDLCEWIESLPYSEIITGEES